jgi:hypothetical protein
VPDGGANREILEIKASARVAHALAGHQGPR